MIIYAVKTIGCNRIDYSFYDSYEKAHKAKEEKEQNIIYKNSIVEIKEVKIKQFPNIKKQYKYKGYCVDLSYDYYSCYHTFYGIITSKEKQKQNCLTLRIYNVLDIASVFHYVIDDYLEMCKEKRRNLNERLE